METESLESRVFRKEYTYLHTGLRNTVDKVVQIAFSTLLIPETIHNTAGNHANCQATQDARTTTFLNAVQDRIKVKPAALHSFIEILERENYTEILAERLKEALRSESEAVAEEREKRAQVQQQVLSSRLPVGNHNFVHLLQQSPTRSSSRLGMIPREDDHKFASGSQPSLSSLDPSSTQSVGGAVHVQPPKSLRIASAQTTTKISSSATGTLVASSPSGLVFIRSPTSRNCTCNHSSAVYCGESFSGPATVRTAGSASKSSAQAQFEEALVKNRAMSPLAFTAPTSGIITRKHSLQTTPPESLQSRRFMGGFTSQSVLPGNSMKHCIMQLQQHESASTSSSAPPDTLAIDLEEAHRDLHLYISRQEKVTQDLETTPTHDQQLPTTDEYHVPAAVTNDEPTSTGETTPIHKIVKSPDNLPLSNTLHDSTHQKYHQTCPNVEQKVYALLATASQQQIEVILKGTCIPSKPSSPTADDTESKHISLEDAPSLAVPKVTTRTESQGSLESSISSTYRTPPSSPIEDCGVNPVQESQLSLEEKEYTKLVAGSGAVSTKQIDKSQASKSCKKYVELKSAISNLHEEIRTLKQTHRHSKEAQDSQVADLKEQLFQCQQENFCLRVTVDDQNKRHTEAENALVQQLLLENQDLRVENQQLKEEVVKVKALAFDYRNQIEADQIHIEDLTRELERVNSMQCPIVREQDYAIHEQNVPQGNVENIPGYFY